MNGWPRYTSRRFQITAAPATEPVTLAQAKAHCRVDTTDDDDLITALITAAREYIEGLTGRAMFTQTITAYWDHWPRRFVLPRAAPLKTVTSVKYLDIDGVEQTLGLAEYLAMPYLEPGEVRQAVGAAMPSVQSVPDAVYVTYTAGESNVANIPQPLKQAILMLVGDWYENRENARPLTMGAPPVPVAALVSSYRVSWL